MPKSAEAGTQIAETLRFLPVFDSKGLITAIVQHADTGTVLMLSHMNAEALKKTLETGEAFFWSRSRQRIWHKGEISGETLKVTELRIDCDQDALLLKVVPGGKGAACHTGRVSCFYRRLNPATQELDPADNGRLFDPELVYLKP